MLSLLEGTYIHIDVTTFDNTFIGAFINIVGSPKFFYFSNFRQYPERLHRQTDGGCSVRIRNVSNDDPAVLRHVPEDEAHDIQSGFP